jgi:signal peptidase I
LDFWHSESFPDAQPVEESRPGVRRVLVDTLETIILSLVLFLAINAVSERIRVESISMQPILYENDFVLVNKVIYAITGLPERGDVIVFRYPPNPDTTPYIKRVIGLPGDQIHISEGKVYVNGNLLIEPYLNTPTSHGGDWTVGEGEVFVMGDNRNNSSDSRAWGMGPLENIIGRAEVVYWPPQDWAFLNQSYAIAAPPEQATPIPATP